MHHVKETTIDGVKFVLIPEKLYDALASYLKDCYEEYCDKEAGDLMAVWTQYAPEIFHAL